MPLDLNSFYISIFASSLFIMGVFALFLGIFKRSALNRLSTRITLLLLITGPIILLLIPAANRLILETGGQPTLFVYALVALSVPLVLGLLASHFVRRPLRQFSKAVASLKQSNYKVELRPTGIGEFDEVFTEFNDLIQRLRHEEKLRKDLISDTSHELKTPLTTMIGQLTAMQEGKHPVTKERVTTLKEQAERLAELVRQLDAYTKARIPATAIPEEVNLRRLCEEFIKQYSLELQQKGITAKLDIADDYIIHAGRGALQQILTNLLQNTLRYSQATEIIIAANVHELSFSDNGKGVPAKSLPYLFERFYRVDESRSKATGGLGLGLAIVRELVESQGWAISAAADNPGLTFIIKLDS